jgi:phosphoglycolate phosphatase-like HAD superfamily hydrolase
VKPVYIEFSTPAGICYIRKDCIKQLAKVDVAVFDCDGVLLDVRESYRGAVAETASILLEALTGSQVDPTIFSKDLFFAFKKTGYFNNDWDITYAYILGALATLSDQELESLEISAKNIGDKSPAKRLSHFIELRKPCQLKMNLVTDQIIRLSESIDVGGVESIDNLLPRIGTELKKRLLHRGSVGQSIISTLFEEVFGGAKLFKETFGYPAQFTKKQIGFIEKETLVITLETVQKLEELLGGRRFGIASGSLMNSARHALGITIDLFPREAQVWHEDIDIAEAGKKKLHKPHGYSLLRAASSFNPCNQVVYVGDTMADLLTARDAATESPNFSFIGVYNTAESSDATRNMFLNSGADAVAPSVNQLPEILQKAKEVKP